MSRRNADDRAVADLEAAVLLLTRAMLRLGYLDDYLSPRGNTYVGQLRESVADLMCEASALLEDETMDDARKARRKRGRR